MADLMVLVDPIDRTECVEAPQGMWCMIVVCDHRRNVVIVGVTDDVFPGRL